jgi:hypothetical protein
MQPPLRFHLPQRREIPVSVQQAVGVDEGAGRQRKLAHRPRSRILKQCTPGGWQKRRAQLLPLPSMRGCHRRPLRHLLSALRLLQLLLIMPSPSFRSKRILEAAAFAHSPVTSAMFACTTMHGHAYCTSSHCARSFPSCAVAAHSMPWRTRDGVTVGGVSATDSSEVCPPSLPLLTASLILSLPTGFFIPPSVRG